jgi:hypothetical protein
MGLRGPDQHERQAVAAARAVAAEPHASQAERQEQPDLGQDDHRDGAGGSLAQDRQHEGDAEERLVAAGGCLAERAGLGQPEVAEPGPQERGRQEDREAGAADREEEARLEGPAEGLAREHGHHERRQRQVEGVGREGGEALRRHEAEARREEAEGHHGEDGRAGEEELEHERRAAGR